MAEVLPTIPNWTVKGRLDGGGQGTTYIVESATDPSRNAVLKLLKNQKSAQARARMKQEAGHLEILNSENARVPHVLDTNVASFKDETIPLFIIMERAPGVTLRKHIEQVGPLTVDAALLFILDICETLSIGHKFNILHRDIKPENIIVNIESDKIVSACLVDFGLSFSDETDEDITKTHEQFRNSFLTLPDTQILGDSKRDRRIDITFVCGILFYILTGQYPQLLRDSQDRAPHRRIRISEDGNDNRIRQIELLLDRGLASDVAARFQSVEELIRRIKGIIDGRQNLISPDPIAAAQQAMVALRKNNRAAQVNAMQSYANKMISDIISRFLNLRNKLDAFIVDVIGIGGPLVNDLPLGIDKIDSIQQLIRIGLPFNSAKFLSHYSIGARGFEGVILHRLYLGNDQGGIVQNASAFETYENWTEILHFDAKGPPDDRTFLQCVDERFAKTISTYSDYLLSEKLSTPSDPSILHGRRELVGGWPGSPPDGSMGPSGPPNA